MEQFTTELSTTCVDTGTEIIDDMLFLQKGTILECRVDGKKTAKVSELLAIGKYHTHWIDYFFSP